MCDGALEVLHAGAERAGQPAAGSHRGQLPGSQGPILDRIGSEAFGHLVIEAPSVQLHPQIGTAVSTARRRDRLRVQTARRSGGSDASRTDGRRGEVSVSKSRYAGTYQRDVQIRPEAIKIP